MEWVLSEPLLRSQVAARIGGGAMDVRCPVLSKVLWRFVGKSGGSILGGRLQRVRGIKKGFVEGLALGLALVR